MITEIAEFKIRPEDRTAFLEAINRAAVAFLAKSEGYLGHSIYASQESPGRVVLQVRWASLEAHTVGFRQSPLFTEWRAIVGPFFAAPPHVEHFELAYTSA